MLYVYTAAVNNPKFIEMQHMTNKKFIKDDYKFIVYNDAKDWADYSNHFDSSIKKQIRETCEKLNIECIDTNNKHHINVTGASDRTADACNEILKDQIKKNGQSLLIDSDMFIINDINIVEKYGDYKMAIVPQEKNATVIMTNNNISNGLQITLKYFWNGLAFFNMPKINNKELLNWNTIKPTDTGGMMYRYIYSTPDLNSYNIKHLWSLNWTKKEAPENLNPKLYDFLNNDPRNDNGKFFAELYDNTYLHYRAGGNWEKRSDSEHILRTDLLFNTLCNLVKE